MSNPSGKTANPAGLTDYLLERMGERAVTEPQVLDDPNHPPVSPYAPKRRDERGGNERVLPIDDHDPLRSPYAPKKARPQPATDPELSAKSETSRPGRAAEELGEQSAVERHANTQAGQNPFPDGTPDCASDFRRLLGNERDGHGNSQETFEEVTKEYPVDLDHAVPLRHALPAKRTKPEQVDAKQRDSILNDRDIEGLEASLRWLQRHHMAARLPSCYPFGARARARACRCEGSSSER